MKRITDKRQALIDAAFELIWTNSYGAVSVDDICRAAGARKGSFYHFFRSKVDLAVAAMEQSFAAVKPSYDSMFSPSVAPAKRFEKLAQFMCESQFRAAAKYSKVCGCPLASLASEMALQEPRIRAAFEDISENYQRYYRNALRDLVAEGALPKATDVNLKAHEVYTYLLGQMTMARIRNDLKPFKRDLKRGLLRTVGLGPRASKAA
jgi:TetR/AcrR family transcriptional regulator, transcriptional repressor for nem operon